MTVTDASDHAVVSVLFQQVQNHFRRAPATQTYQFTLGFIQGQWRFKVVQNWQQWMDASLQHEFSGRSPSQAILAFLEYVEDHKIDVAELAKD